MNEQINRTFGARSPQPGRVAVMSDDRVLALDLEMMLREAGYEVLELSLLTAFPAAEDNVSSAIVDMGDRPEEALQALIRLSSEKIPHVVLSDDAADVPLDLTGGMMRGALAKPIRVDELLPLLGQSVPVQRGLRRTP